MIFFYKIISVKGVEYRMYDSLKVKAGNAVDDTRVAAQPRYLLRFDLKNSRTYMEKLHYP
jgi:hypothetical protein